jgi:predicted O-methyltransferase YrrM
MARYLTPSIDYIRKLYAAQDSLLTSIDESLLRLNIPMHIGAEEGKLLQMLITLHNAKTIVEIGTLAGYSTLWMARALPAGGHIYTINKDPAHITMAKHFFDQSEVRDSITMLEGDAHAMLPQLSSEAPFDLLFIDADKISYNDYLDWAEKNIRKGGLIIADNTLLHGTMGLDLPPQNISSTTWNNMRRFNERLADPEKYFTAMIATQEGLTVALKRF